MPPGPSGFWSKALSHEFLPWIQARGHEYVRRGAVLITDATQDSVSALVRGGDEYAVRLRVRGRDLDFSCTCAYFLRSRDGCKHVFGTLVLAEETGALGAPEAGPRAHAARPDRNDWLVPLLRDQPSAREETGPEREVVYVIDATATAPHSGLVLAVLQRQRRAKGEWSALKPLRLRRDFLPRLTPPDQEIAALLLGARDELAWEPFYGAREGSSSFRLDGPLSRIVMPLICRTGRARLQSGREGAAREPLTWDEQGPWELVVRVRERGADYEVEGVLARGDEERPLAQAALVTTAGLVFDPPHVSEFSAPAGPSWVVALRPAGTRLTVPRAEAGRLIRAFLISPAAPRLDVPEELRIDARVCAPQPRLRLSAPAHPGLDDSLRCEVFFDYDGVRVAADSPGWAVLHEGERTIIARDRVAEAAALARLRTAGVRRPSEGASFPPGPLALAPSRMPTAVRALVQEGWLVEAQDRLYRPAGAVRLAVKSGVDWFDLMGSAEFGGLEVPLPRLLTALRKGERTLVLDDGSVGMIPEEWARRYGMLASLASSGEDVRFSPVQIGLLDALLATQPEADIDEAFRKARSRLLGFEGVRPVDAPPGFVGRLRGYQRAGLGWLHFLRDLGFGGCLADDMGLGKTVQVLALLQSVASTRGADVPHRPSLVVVPRSLVFNWKAEAARFTPGLRVVDHTGVARTRSRETLLEADLILTTYGTLRRDALLLKDVPFDYAILDEAQAVKNPGTEAAKAARLLDARHRLALSGTPVENHLGELASLFEFLNPGMLGRLGATRAGHELDDESRALLSGAVRPFVLRRTKEQVIRDLPAKTEQTLHCELDREQRALYDELRAHYREVLLDRVDREGMARSKMQVLTALLRLRQAACHPGLLDASRSQAPSAKLEALLPALTEVLAEGHKALVFSQFTSFLALVRERVDALGMTYEYLDGRTRDRAARVRRFQEDPACPLFLISLKAGGLGLNLTAADYVFLLDPWWNPAVEAQAVDRAHRLGQTRPVFAYRLIARDTVEEKIVELQEQKRALADAIITADGGMLRALKREDLERLLS